MLGRHLENEVDSRCEAAASAYLVFGGRLPWYYLSIGVARYVFLLGVWIRSRLGLPVHPLRHSKSGRVLAGIQMNALLVALVPMVPVSTVPVGMAFATVPFLAGFARDFYGICTGRRPARALRERFQSYG
jgi:CDP-diacylglycerol--glycerol-3-phosphate 3-phosphatidyltransferase